MSSRVSIKDVVERLGQQLEALCVMLLPGGKRCGAMFECGSIAGEPGKTLKVHLEGARRGKWIDWNGQEDKGDPLDLWARARGVTLPEALRQAKDWLGIREPDLCDKTYARPQDDKPAPAHDGKVMHWLATKRKIEASTANRFRIQVDAEKGAIVFPSYGTDGITLINRSYRALETVDGKKKVWQDKGAAPCLWGWHGLSGRCYQQREILLCEGQIDAMTWAQWGVDALSIPNGSGQTWIDYEWENLEAFTTIFLSFDSDGKSDGNLATAITRLGKHRVKVVRLPHKDANDALLAGCTAAQAAGWIAAADYVPIKSLVTADYFRNEVANEFFPEGEKPGHELPITIHDDPSLNFRYRPAELTVWTGVSSHGKSTVVNLAALQLAILTKRPAMIISLEMKAEKIIRRVILGLNYAIQNAEDARQAADCLKQWLLFYDKVGSIAREEVLELLSYAHARYGIKHAVIDSLMRVRGLEEDYPAQNEFITQLVTFTRETGVHVHLVAHPRKNPGHNSPQAHDIKGSGHIRDNADNVMVVWRNREKEKLREAKKLAEAEAMPDAILYVEKDREEGEYREFPLTYDRTSYRHVKWLRPAKQQANNYHQD